MLGRRLASAAVIIGVLVALLVLDFHFGGEDSFGRPGLVMAIVMIVIATLATGEQVHLLDQGKSQLKVWPTILIGPIAVAICCMPILWRDYPVDCPIGIFGWSMLAVTFAVGMSALVEIVGYNGDGNATDRIAKYCLIHVQSIILFGFIVAHRILQYDNSVGLLALITLIATVKMSDAAAYFTGKSIGKNKLAPKLSPGKTIEGAIGGVVGAFVGAAIVVYFVARWFDVGLNLPWWWIIVYALAVTMAGIVGDLFESLSKRDANLKDSSSWLPGLGGVLDIVDSLVFAAPVSFFVWQMV